MRLSTLSFLLGFAAAQVEQQVLQQTDTSSGWDFITRGSDIQVLDVDSSRYDFLDSYTLRTRVQDPTKLGIDTVKQFSGYLDDEESDKHIFYWFFESRNDPENDPVVLWLNGGPGCSSMVGLFFELGPSSIDDNLKPQWNPYSWNSNASTIFIDQPINTGFSYSGSASINSTYAAADDLHAMLSLFFTQFPQYAKQDFHIAGESYVGHYLPATAHNILKKKDQYNNINLKSILIGNGLTDAVTQVAAMAPMACGQGGWPAVLDYDTCAHMETAVPRCQELGRRCYDGDFEYCNIAQTYCATQFMMPYYDTGRNVYDIRVMCEGDIRDTCYPKEKDVGNYLNQSFVRAQLGAEVPFVSCNSVVGEEFMANGDFFQPMHWLMPDILEELPVLIYAGDADWICNWLGNLAWTEKLDWPGKDAYNKAMLEPLIMDGKSTGQVKSSGNLTFMRIHAGGHMLPMNQPEASLDFFNRWLGGEWW